MNAASYGVPVMDDTASLARRAATGNADAFAELMRRYRGLVFSFCFGHTGDLKDSEDLTQEVFVAVYRSLPSLEEPERFVAWLHGVTRNVCKMHARRRTSKFVPFEEPELPASDEAVATRSIELQNLLHRALMGVTEASREVLSLHYLGGYSYAEIAALCGLPEKTVKSRLHEARRQLKSRLLQMVAELCGCARSTDHTLRCVMPRCGAESCECVDLLLAD